MSDPVERLLDEFAVRLRRGEGPDLRAYLARAGERADELAALVDVLLQAVPPPDAPAEAVALSREWVEGASPLLALRRERRLRRSQVVDALLARLGLDPARREKLRLRYHELETGQLEPAGVDRRVWEALAETLRARADDLAAWTRPPRLAQPHAAYFRLAAPASGAAAAPPSPASGEPDEVDELFGLGRSAH